MQKNTNKNTYEKSFIDDISNFIDKNSKHGFEIVALGLANIVAIFLVLMANQQTYLIWAIFGFIILELILSVVVHIKKQNKFN